MNTTELTYKNVARYVAENVKIDENKLELDLDISNADSYSILYLNLLIFFYESSKVGFQTHIKYPSDKLIFGPSFFIHFKPDNEEFKWKLAQTMHVMRDIAEEDIESEFDELIFRNKINIDVSHAKECMGEILSNVTSHSGENVYLMRCNLNEDKRYFDFVIGDVGFGIKNALSRKDVYKDLENKSDCDAIVKAFEKGVTSKVDARGYGLPMIQEYFLEKPECKLFLSSGNGYYMIDHSLSKSPIRTGSLHYDLQGVQILMRYGW